MVDGFVPSGQNQARSLIPVCRLCADLTSFLKVVVVVDICMSFSATTLPVCWFKA